LLAAGAGALAPSTKSVFSMLTGLREDENDSTGADGRLELELGRAGNASSDPLLALPHVVMSGPIDCSNVGYQ